MATRLCINCEKPMFSSLVSIWITKDKSVFCHNKCLKEYNIKLVDKIIINAINGIKRPSRHDMVIFNRWYKHEFVNSGSHE